MKTTIQFFAIALSTMLAFTACEKTPDVPNEEEVITTVNYMLTPVGGGTPITMTFTDLDGDGGNAPTIVGGTLDTNETYNGAITLFNASETPIENITTEIESEKEEHQFFFSSTISGVNIAYADQDADGNPVGLANRLSTGNAGSGNVTITLRHEPNKTASGVAGGDITNAGGETDIEITFPINVQ